MRRWGAVAARFDDPALEAAFLREQARETLPIVRAGYVLGVGLWLVVAFALRFVTPIDPVLLVVVGGTMVAIDLVSLWLVRGSPSLDRLDALGIAGTGANAMAIIVLTISAPASDRQTLPGLMLTMVYAVAVFRIRFPRALVPGAMIVGAFVVAVASRQTPAVVAFEAFLLAAMLVVGLLGVAVLERSNRERFMQGRTIEAQREAVAREKAKSDALLRTILPTGIVERLRERREAVADAHDATSLLFADLVGFTALAERLGPQRTAGLLNGLVSRWDVLAAEAGVEKIKTIGDAYFAAAGVPEPQPDHAHRIVELGLAMIRATADAARTTGEPLAIRVGVHSGPVVAGVIGRTKFAYDLWGDTVNVASRLESSGVPGEVQASAATVALLDGEFAIVPRGDVDLKGKGPMATFLVRPKAPAAGADDDVGRMPAELAPAAAAPGASDAGAAAATADGPSGGEGR